MCGELPPLVSLRLPKERAFFHRWRLTAINIKIEVSSLISRKYRQRAFRQRLCSVPRAVRYLLTQAHAGPYAKQFFIFNRRATEFLIFTDRLFEETFAGSDLILEHGINTSGSQVRINVVLPLIRDDFNAFWCPMFITNLSWVVPCNTPTRLPFSDSTVG